MFAFLRKYQRYFYLVISIIVIISFSFFGTYNALPNEDTRSQTAFYATDGSAITRQELDEMVRFLSTDNEDKMIFGGVWGPNFLNDGVIKKDFLQTGLADVIAQQFPEEIDKDLEPRLQHEKNYILYSHPDASFVSTESVWAYAAPGLKNHFDALQNANSPDDPAAFQARVRLFLGEKRFPSSYLRQFLRYQEKQYSWLKPDPDLARTDLSLFGYHTLEDWFGPRFIHLVAEFIIDSAKTASQQGYDVPMDEALADLNRNSIVSFQQNANNPHLGVANSQEYLNEQLRLMGMDQRMAVKIWQNVLLFRRLFQDAGNAVFVDPTTFANFIGYAKESVSGEIYQLPKELRLADYRTLQKFEIYLEVVSKTDSKQPLSLPIEFLSTAEVKKNAPELIQKRYLLEIAEVDKNALLSKVSLKETWSWEVDEKNWEPLKKQFADLKTKRGDTREERFLALEALDTKTRNKVDAFAQAAILEAHPEWIAHALDNSESKTIEAQLTPKRGTPLVTGLQDATPLITLLDAAEIVNELGNEITEKEANKKLAQYSSDQRHFYKIQVLARQPNEEILTFAEANRNGSLDALLDRKLKAFYESAKSTHLPQFQNFDKSWKPYEEIRDALADLYFAKTLKALKIESKNESLTGALAAAQRLRYHVQNVKDKIQKDTGKIADLTIIEMDTLANQLKARKPLIDQWRLEKQSFRIDRSSQDERINLAEAIAVSEWSDLANAPNGGIYFYRKIDNQTTEDGALIAEKSKYARQQLSNDLQTVLGQRLATKWKAQNAISLGYMQAATEMTID